MGVAETGARVQILLPLVLLFQTWARWSSEVATPPFHGGNIARVRTGHIWRFSSAGICLQAEGQWFDPVNPPSHSGSVV